MRGSYAVFASQLDSNRAPLTVSQIPYYSYVYYAAVDTNGNRIADLNEFTTFQGVAGFDPDNPLGGNPDRIGDYSSPMTHELLFGVEHELFKNFGVSANVTWRRYTGFNWLNYPGVTGADFTQAGVFSGTAPGIGSYNVPYYHVNEDALPADLGQVYETRIRLPPALSRVRDLGHQTAWPIDWMMRVGWSTNDHREYLKGPGAERGSDAGLHHDRRLPERGWRPGHDAEHRQRQELDLPGAAEVPAHRQRRLPGELGHHVRRATT